MTPTKTTGEFSLAYIVMQEEGQPVRKLLANDHLGQDVFERVHFSNSVPDRLYKDSTELQTLPERTEGYTIRELVEYTREQASLRSEELGLEKPILGVINPATPIEQEGKYIDPNQRVYGSVDVILRDRV